VKGVFLGAVFVGQILRENDIEAQKIFDSFLLNHKDVFANNLQTGNDPQCSIESNQLTRQIELLKKLKNAELDKPYNDEDNLIACLTTRPYLLNMKQLSDKRYSELVKSSISCVDKLLKDLKNIIRGKRAKIIKKVFDDLSKSADDMCCEYDKDRSIEMVKNYEKVLCVLFADKMNQFGVKNIRILGLIQKPLVASESLMKLNISSVKGERNTEGILSFEKRDNYGGYIVDQEIIHPWEPVCSIEYGEQKFNENFYKLFKSEPDPKSNREKLRISANTHMVMLYQTWLVLIEAEDISSRLEEYSSLLKEFKGLTTKYLSRYELRLSEFVIDKYMLTLRLYRHECSQVANAIRERNDNDYKTLITRITEVKANKKSDVELSNALKKLVWDVKNENLRMACNDIDDNVKLIQHMADTIGIIIGLISREKLNRHEKRSYFVVGRDIVVKWKEARQNTLIQRERNTKIVIINNNRGKFFDKVNRRWAEKEFSEIYHRKRLIDMVIYNLMENALKYSHHGTKIFITIGNEYTNDNEAAFAFVIENYGTFIEPSPKAYELYYRGNKQGEEMPLVDGDGLGLYIVKSISDMLDLDIRYNCDVIDPEHNIGLIESYIRRGKDRDLAKLLLLKYDKCREMYYKIINTDRPNYLSDNPLPEIVLETDINKPTFHVKFEFTIQIKSTI